MGAMKDLSIQINETVHAFEVGTREGEGPFYADAYDAFYDLLNILNTVLESGGQTPEPNDSAYNTLDNVAARHFADEPGHDPEPNSIVYNTYTVGQPFVAGVSSPPGTFAEQLRELSAQVAALAAAQAAQSEELPDAEEVPSDEKYSTGQTLHVTMYDGSTYSIENVESFHLSLDRTGEWPVGWDVGDDPDAEPKAGYWGDDAEFHAFDSRYRTPGFRGGW